MLCCRALCRLCQSIPASPASTLSYVVVATTQLYSMYVGEGESLLRDTFRRARLAAPAILFLDEIDALAPNRGGEDGGGEPSSSSGGPDAGLRLLSTLLTEMDGMEQTTGRGVCGMGQFWQRQEWPGWVADVDRRTVGQYNNARACPIDGV